MGARSHQRPTGRLIAPPSPSQHSQHQPAQSPPSVHQPHPRRPRSVSIAHPAASSSTSPSSDPHPTRIAASSVGCILEAGWGGCGGSMGLHGARDSGIRGAAVMSHGVWIQVIRERLTPSPRASGSPEQWLSTSQGSWTASGLAVHEPGLVDSHAPLCLRRVEDPANALRSPHRQSLIASSYPNRIAIPPSLHSPRIQFPRHWFPSVTVPSLASPSRSHLALQRFHMYMADASRLCAETRRPSIQRCSAITAS